MAVEKQQRKRKAERKWRANEDSWKLCEKLKLGDQLLIIFKKLLSFQSLFWTILAVSDE